MFRPLLKSVTSPKCLSSRGPSRSLSKALSVSPHLDFRAFVDALRDDNGFSDITAEVDPKLEVAATIRFACEQRAKAP